MIQCVSEASATLDIATAAIALARTIVLRLAHRSTNGPDTRRPSSSPIKTPVAASPAKNVDPVNAKPTNGNTRVLVKDLTSDTMPPVHKMTKARFRYSDTSPMSFSGFPLPHPLFARCTATR